MILKQTGRTSRFIGTVESLRPPQLDEVDDDGDGDDIPESLRFDYCRFRF